MALSNGKNLDRVAFSPREFSELFGKSATWGYRQIYANKVKTITEFGRILIPASEVEKVLAQAEDFNGIGPGMGEVSKTKPQIQTWAKQVPNAWENFVKARRALAKPHSKQGSEKTPSTGSARRAAHARLKRGG